LKDPISRRRGERQVNGRTQFVTSKDGTPIAYEVVGDGPPLVYVAGALGSRAISFARAMRAELAKSFTVYDYDRRGRGESGDTQPYAVARELEDLAAVIEIAGGAPYVCATSSGAALALEAAAAGIPMQLLVAHEPPYAVGKEGASFDRDYPKNVAKLVAEGKREAAVKYFMRTVGVPGFFVWMMRFMSFWKDALAAAHTLPYDAAVINEFELPEARLRSIRVPTVVLVGGSTPRSLRAAADAVARVVPGAIERVVPKQNHGIKPEALRQALLAIVAAHESHAAT
jgi:pimeloyl-ACP methyl ester carboxylesterase